MPQTRNPDLVRTNGGSGGSVSDAPECPGTVKQDDASADIVEFQKLQPAGSTAAGIASELNNLLSVIIGNAELLNEAPDNPKLTRYLSDYILSAAERGATLAQRLQSLSRH